MSRILPVEDFVPPPEGTTVALGFFDGVHRGHQAILNRALALSPSHSVVFTFRNHPASVISSHSCPPLITDFVERSELLLDMGLDVVWTDFDRPLSELEPKQFVEEILVARLGARQVVSGANYRFGYRARGTPALLKKYHRFGMEVVADVLEGDEIISSSRIRQCILEGQVRQVQALLGRPFSISGRVQRGDQIGRKLNAPTANLPVEPPKIIPRYGGYAVRVWWRGRSYPAVANLGVRPTAQAEGKPPLLEAHLLDFQGDLYGEYLQVDFVEWIRGEQRFPSLEALQQQIHTDMELARQLLA